MAPSTARGFACGVLFGASVALLLHKALQRTARKQAAISTSSPRASPSATPPSTPRCEVTAESIDVARVLAQTTHPGAGAVASFVGSTRDNIDDAAGVNQRVARLEYEGYEPMAVKQMEAMCDIAESRWALTTMRVVHRVGVVPVGEASVVIAASSAHRKEALAAVAWAIDELKATVPIWKKEFYVDASLAEAWKVNKEWQPQLIGGRPRPL